MSMKLFSYDIYLSALSFNCKKHNTTKEKGLKATSIIEACQLAISKHPNLGCTPTTVSMAWLAWPQPAEERT